jgi:hypothetical protein
MSRVKSRIGVDTNPFSKPPQGSTSLPERQPLFQRFLKREEVAPPAPGQWSPPLTRLDSGLPMTYPSERGGSATGGEDDARGFVAVQQQPASSIYDVVDCKSEPAPGPRPTFFSDSLRSFSEKLGKQQGYVTAFEFMMATALGAGAQPVLALQREAERHGTIARVHRARGHLYMNVRATGQTLGECQQQMEAFGRAIGKPIKISSLPIGQEPVDPNTRPEELEIREAVRVLGIAGATIETKSRMRGRWIHGVAKIPIVRPPPAADSASLYRYEQALLMLKSRLSRLNNSPSFDGYVETQSCWMYRGVQQDKVFGVERGQPYLPLEAPEGSDLYIYGDAEAKLAELFKHLGILPDAFVALPETAWPVPAQLTTSSKPMKEVLTAAAGSGGTAKH